MADHLSRTGPLLWNALFEEQRLNTLMDVVYGVVDFTMAYKATIYYVEQFNISMFIPLGK